MDPFCGAASAAGVADVGEGAAEAVAEAMAEADADELEVAIAGVFTESADGSTGLDGGSFGALGVRFGDASGISGGALGAAGTPSEAGRLTAPTVPLFPEVLS